MKKTLTEDLIRADVRSFRKRGQVYDLMVNFTTTRCNFGGKRYWFKCPRCARRVWVLYKEWSSWGCVRCFNLTYRSRVERKHGILHHAVKVLRMGKAIDDLERVKKRSKYRGQPTRKQRKLDEFCALARISSALIQKRKDVH